MSTEDTTPKPQDKQITVAVPEDRVPEFYVWFAAFLKNEGSRGPGRRRRHEGHRGGPHRRGYAEAEPWSTDDFKVTVKAEWLYSKLAPPARDLFDMLSSAPGERFSGNDIAAKLKLDKGAHGVAGILAWPGRYCRKLSLDLPILTAGREDGGTDYYKEPDVAALFAAAATKVNA